MKYTLLILVVVFMAACTNKNIGNESVVRIKHKFKNEDVAWFKNSGSSSIKGVAKFKAKNGDLRFGKEFRIELNPYTAYTKERLNHIYQNDDAGYVFIESGIPKFVPDPDGYHETRKTFCNEKGEFEFKDLPAGDYYVIAFMLWDKTGGGLMHHVKLSSNETKEIEMSNF